MSLPQYAIAHQSTSPAEAELIRGLLEEAGIRALIPDRNNPLPGVDLTPFSAEGGAGCDVVVPARDLARAREVLEEAREAGRLAAAEGTEDDADD
jgi:hypothetical protein